MVTEMERVEVGQVSSNNHPALRISESFLKLKFLDPISDLIDVKGVYW